MTEIHSLSGAYAVDALDDLERAQFERHLAECGECREEVESLRAAATSLASLTETAPPSTLRDRVLADIATVRPLPPVVATTATPSRTGAWGRRTNLLVAAAAAVILAASGVAVWQPWDDTSQAPALSAADRVLGAPDAEVYTREFPDGSRASVTRSKQLGRAVIVTADMAPPPEGKVYELWLSYPGSGMVPAGLMPREPDNTLILNGDAADAVGFGITVEPAGGSEVPTGETVALIPFKKA